MVGFRPTESDLRTSLKTEVLLKELPKKLRSFYRSQNKKIEAMLEALEITNCARNRDGLTPFSVANIVELSSKGTRLAVKFSFWANIVLFGLKIVASLWSLSLSVIASTVDSLIDLLSGAIIYFSQLFSTSS